MKYTLIISIFVAACTACSHGTKTDQKTVGPSSCKLDQPATSPPIVTQGDLIYSSIFLSDVEQLRKLIHEGADIQTRDKTGYSYLHLAAGVGNPEMIEILIQAGLPVDLQLGTKQSTPAHSAVRWGKLSSLQTLVKNGANLKIRDASGKTPADIALEENQTDILDYLRQHSL
jgi:ankyrin repeat protein